MHYYEVLVGSQKYHGSNALTYSSEQSLAPGTVVVVPMQRQIIPGLIVKEVPNPSFTAKLIEKVVADQPLPNQVLGLITWLQEYYPATIGQLVSLFVPQSTTSTPRPAKATHKTPSHQPKQPPQLTSQQRSAYETIAGSSKNVLLHGDTGTGKTRLYLELAARALSKGKSVLLLTPEIGLTPQLERDCKLTFPEQTVVVHSDLAPAQRRNLWLQILQSPTPLIVIGPRSALFSPLRDIGLIVVDEFHDTAYKQQQSPYYLATRVAAKLAELHQAQLLLGSATPPIGDYYLFEQKKLPIVRMDQSAVGAPEKPADISIVDLRKREEFTRSPWISDILLKTLEHALSKGEQSLMFLNRRGTARLVLCQVCGWQAMCVNCDLPLTYHDDKHSMQCHTCGHHENVPLLCPDCSSNDIIFRQIGTKSLMTHLKTLMPHATIERFDSDTPRAEHLSRQYENIHSGKIDILVGTQMLTKGLDLPRLSTLGIIAADSSLSFPDFSSEERNFQQLTQVLGRIHRGHLPGVAVIQTYNPDSTVLLAATKKDYAAFYSQQIAERKMYAFPPFRFLLKLSCSRATSKSAQTAAEKLASHIRDTFPSVEIAGPTPAFVEKTNNKYHWQLTLKATRRTLLTKIIKELPANWAHDIDPVDLL